MGHYFAEKSEKAFRQIIYIFFLAFGLFFLFVFKVYQKIYSSAGMLIHMIKTACNCVQMKQFYMHPYIFTTLIILSISILAFIGYAVYKLFRLFFQTRRFLRKHTLARIGLSVRLERAINDLALAKNRVIEIDTTKPVVFCFGLLQAKICVSSGLVKMLDQAELKMVLLHEYQHVISREPLKLFIVKYFQSVFFFLPGIKTYIKKYATLSELAADERATAYAGNKIKLASAIFKISQKEEQQVFRTGLALSFFSAVIAERVNRLSDDAYTPKFKFFNKGFVLGALVMIVFSLFVSLFLSDASKAFAMHNTGSCAATDNNVLSLVSSPQPKCNMSSTVFKSIEVSPAPTCSMH